MALWNVYATVRDYRPPTFVHQLRNRRDRSDPALAEHLRGLESYLARTPRGRRPMTARLWAVLEHVEHVQQQIALEVEGADVLAAQSWVKEMNGVVFTTDGALRDPAGRILIPPPDQRSDEGDPDAQVPYPADALHRKTRTTELLARRGLVPLEELPPGRSARELEPRPVAEITSRCRALVACAVRAESCIAGQPIPLDAIFGRIQLRPEELSAREAEFLRQETPDEASLMKHGWGYEALAALLWTQGRGPLPFPDAICAVSAVVETMLSPDASPSEPPSLDAVLDELDLCYRLTWLAREQRLDPHSPTADVAIERYRALRWVTGTDRNDWDEVDTPS